MISQAFALAQQHMPFSQAVSRKTPPVWSQQNVLPRVCCSKAVSRKASHDTTESPKKPEISTSLYISFLSVHTTHRAFQLFFRVLLHGGLHTCSLSTQLLCEMRPTFYPLPRLAVVPQVERQEEVIRLCSSYHFYFY